MDTGERDAATVVGVGARLRHVRFSYDGGASWTLDDLSLDIAAGERICLIGANGSGKSTLARLIAGLAAPDAGKVRLAGHLVFDAEGADADAYRLARRSIGAVFQNPEDQIVATRTEDDVSFGPENLGLGRARIAGRIAHALDAVGMAAHRHDDPTRMSGGQQQRIAIAGMLAMRPRMLVLDEPTAMLDPAARAEVMRILDRLQAAGATIVHVTHHPEELAHADRIVRLERGCIVEGGEGASSPRPAHSMAETETCASDGHAVAVRSPDRTTARTSEPDIALSGSAALDSGFPAESASSSSLTPALEISHVSFSYPGAGRPAVDDVSLSIAPGEVVALMGANGSGKSTLTRLIAALDKPDAGSIRVGETVVAHNGKPLPRRRTRALRRTLGLVMQHPERQLFAETVRDDVSYGPRNQGLDDAQVAARAEAAMESLGIAHLADRSPFHLSGGQQRLAAIAGVIACEPKVLVMDEPTAGLDAEASERIAHLVRDLKARGMAMLIVTHSLAEAHTLADRIVHMDGGHLAQSPTSSAPAEKAKTQETTPPNHTASSNDCTTTHHDEPSVNHAKHQSIDHNTIHGHSAIQRTTPPNSRSATQPTQSSNDCDTACRGPLLSRLDPRVKLIAFLVLMFSAFAINNLWQLVLGATMLVGLTAAARLSPLRLLASTRVILTLVMLMGLVNLVVVRSGTPLIDFGWLSITDDGARIALLYTCRFMLVVLMGAVFLATTMPTVITDALASLLSPLTRFGVHTQEIALVTSLALRFLPTLTGETRAIIDAQAARGGSIETGSPIRRLKAMTAIVIPVFAGTLRHADNLSLALDARCYEAGARRTPWREMTVRTRDIVFAVITLAYLSVLATLGITL